MEEQIPPSQPPAPQPSEPPVTPEMLEMLKARARQAAVQQTLGQREGGASIPPQPQRVVYVRRNLTVAEILIVILLSCGIVTGIQWTWNFATNVLPRIEIKVN